MSTDATTKEDLIRSLDDLPPESLVEVRRFIENLRLKTRDPSRKVVKLGGLWKDFPPVTEEDIDQARKEMWGRLGERDD